MKSIAGSVIVLAGAVLMGLTSKQFPEELPPIISLVLIVIGLVLVFRGGSANETSRTDKSSPEG